MREKPESPQLKSRQTHWPVDLDSKCHLSKAEPLLSGNWNCYGFLSSGLGLGFRLVCPYRCIVRAHLRPQTEATNAIPYLQYSIPSHPSSMILAIVGQWCSDFLCFNKTSTKDPDLGSHSLYKQVMDAGSKWGTFKHLVKENPILRARF